ncbi:hypothetical protein PK28_06365 [Hymenobacter sp. DG25B]|nr:hypothetical protein PK28_06365 [Hymenobacter sp. DG25B]
MVSSYDSYNNHLGTTFADWKNNIWATTAGTSYQLSYTDNAEIKSRIYKLFNVAANQFVNKTKTYYKDFAAVILAAKNTQQLNKLLQLAPNPASDQIIFKLAGLPMHELLTVEVFNSLGQSIQSFRLSPQKANQGHILDVSNLKAGVYSLRLLTSEGPITQRFVRE